MLTCARLLAVAVAAAEGAGASFMHAHVHAHSIGTWYRHTCAERTIKPHERVIKLAAEYSCFRENDEEDCVCVCVYGRGVLRAAAAAASDDEERFSPRDNVYVVVLVARVVSPSSVLEASFFQGRRGEEGSRRRVYR